MNFLSKKDINLPKRNKYSKKGDNGRVLVIGGSKDYTGAVALAGLAALRSGCDWVTIAAPEKAAWAVNCLSADLVTIKLKGDYFSLKHHGEIAKLAKKHDIVLLGNGLGLRKETKSFVKKTIKKINNLKVIDADAIKSLSLNDLENSIITPHIKELEIFLQNSKINNPIVKKITNEKNIEKKAALLKKTIENHNIRKNNNKNKIKYNFFEKNNIILLKGPIDIILSKNQIKFNKTGNAGMSKAGTGDVLAGLCAGFLAQGKDLMQSAVNAAYFNGLIGDILLKKKKGFTYLASDMVEEIGRILK